MSFFAELKRRNVLRVGAAYLVAAWLVIQVVETIFPAFGFGDVAVRNTTIVFAIGFIPALIFAWAFELTPEGLKKESEVDRSQSVTPRTGKKLDRMIMVGLAVALGYFAFDKFVLHPQREATNNEQVAGQVEQARQQGRTEALVESYGDHSIAVLPFDNLSGDPANGFLGDGLAEELANLLTRVPALEVASRTSAFSFKGRQMPICEIATELGVRYVVEGSLRRNGDMLAITAQLIECPRGTHAWSNTYRRAIAGLPSIEDDIAGSVVEALKIMLAPETRERMQRRSEVSQDAYQSYLQAVSELRNFTDPGSLDRAIQLFQDATSADPTYAEAYAGLCEAHVQRYRSAKTVRDVGAAEDACAQAVRLDRGLPAVHTALGLLYVATGQSVQAEREYRRAIELAPENDEAWLGLGAVLSSQGDIESADRAYQEAIRLRSRYWRVYDAYGGFLFEQRRWPAAIAQYRRGVELAPQNARMLSNLGGVLFLSGDFTAAADTFRRSVDIAPTSAGYSNAGTTYYYAGRYDEALAMFEQATRIAPEDHQLWANLGDAYRRTPDQGELARDAYARAADLARGALRVNPDAAATRIQLAYYLVRQDQAALAATELETAGPAPDGDVYSHYYAALVYKELGDLEAAIAETRKAIESGYPATLLRADPEFAVILLDRTLAAEMEAPR
jgi:TolB-like protein/Tfp pilus assembly protein PilF